MKCKFLRPEKNPKHFFIRIDEYRIVMEHLQTEKLSGDEEPKDCGYDIILELEITQTRDDKGKCEICAKIFN